jgi:hypothetical protein
VCVDRPPLQVSLPGVYRALRETERSLYLLAAPTAKLCVRLLLRTELPKFLEGFLVEVR